MSRIGERIASYKREHPEQNDLSPEISKLINDCLLKYSRTLNRVKNEEQTQSKASEFRREQILKEIPKIALMLTILHNISDIQQNNGFKISNQEFMKIIHKLQKEIQISPDSFKHVQIALFEFLQARIIARRLLTNSLQSRKILVKEYFKTHFHQELSDKDVHELATKIRVVEGLLGIFCYIEKESFERFTGKKNSNGEYSKIYFSSQTKKKNKKKYLIRLPIELQPKEKFDLATNRIYGKTRRHEELHGISDFISEYLSRRVKAEEHKINEGKFLEKRNKLWYEFTNSQGDINDENSAKQLAFIKFLDFCYYENFLKPSKDRLLRELASQLIGGYVRYIHEKQTEPFPFFDHFLYFYKDDKRIYKKKAFDSIDQFKLKSFAPKEQQILLSKRKEYWKELVIKEMDEITNLIADIIRNDFNYLNILFRIISISNSSNILKNIKNFIKLLEEEKQID